jgi:hypothetical protein
MVGKEYNYGKERKVGNIHNAVYERRPHKSNDHGSERRYVCESLHKEPTKS